SPTGTVRLASGLTAHYAYHYNRNALAEVLRAGDALVALTDSGNLLRFDRATLGLTKERFGLPPATCLGRGEGDTVLAGFGDVRVYRIDPRRLEITELARLPGKVQWVRVTATGSGRPGQSRVVAVVEQEMEVESQCQKFRLPSSVVHDLGSGKTFAVDP